MLGNRDADSIAIGEQRSRVSELSGVLIVPMLVERRTSGTEPAWREMCEKAVIGNEEADSNGRKA